MNGSKAMLKKLSYICIAIIAAILIMYVSDSDYDVEVQENENWCQMVRNGFWHSDRDEYVLRCG